LAGGSGTRLYPLTENFPKPLLKVKNKPILDWLIEDINSLGLVDEFIVISNHKFYNIFKNWADDKSLNITVLNDGTLSNQTRLGAVKDIQFAIDSLKIDDDLLVIAGDNLLDFSLTKFIVYAKNKGTSCIMRYYEPSIEKLKKTGVAEVDKNDKVICLTEKPSEPKSNYACPPFYFYAKNDVKLVKQGILDGCGVDAPGSFIAWLCTKTIVHAMEMPGKRYDIGNLESYEKVQKEFLGIN
ncbi:MAG: nucleotidyltransferase family protein, partial [Clostridia bacterium]|nr:nucleotidyltransferase family protein [Clostridia bacterium]